MYSSFAHQGLIRLLLSALVILAAASSLLGVSRPVRAQVTTIEVTNGNNSGPGSLRQAIENSLFGGTIIFAPGVNTITLTDDQLWIETNLTIDGGSGVTIERSSTPGTRQFRIFEIASSAQVTLANLTIRNGSLNSNGGGILNEGELTILSSTISNNTTSSFGGGINNNRNGELWIEDSTISNNRITSFGNGGGINNIGDMTMINSSVTGNISGLDGGGIASIGQSADLIVIDSDISENTAPQWGGGIFNTSRFGDVIVARSTLHRNTARSQGGGIYNRGFLDVINSTLSFNEASGDGGGIYNLDTLDVVNSTISNNMADENGGGIYNLNTLHVFNSTIYENGAEMNGGGIVNFGAMVTLANTIVAGSTAGEDYSGIGNNINLVLQGNNIVQDGSVSNVETVDPLLGPLADNGGPTHTHLPQTGSRAINGGVNSVVPDDDADLDDDDDTDEQIPFDQRSLRRVVGGSVDIGAVEVGAGDVAYTIAVNPTMVDEGDSGDSATATVSITRNGATSTTSSVDVVLGGIANEGSDYTFALTSSGAHFDDGTLRFDPDTSVATFAVMVQGDIIAEPDETVRMMLANATALETATINVPNPVTLTITDDDVAGVTIDPVERTISEMGQTDSYTVVLNTQPTAHVTISVASDDTSEATVDPATLTFTTGDWDTPQTVTVTGVDDDVDDGDQTVTINHSASGGGYGSVSIAGVDVTVTDDDSAGVSVGKSSLTLSEPSSTGTYSITLESEPTADVEITVTSSDTSEATVEPATLTFTASDWDEPQTVTVTGVDDDVDDGDIEVTISHSASGGGYDGVSIAEVGVTVQDNDTAGVSLSKSSLTVSEDGSTGTYEVMLTSQPTATVTIAVASGDVGEATVEPATLTFTTGDWDEPQTVTVTGVDDNAIDGTQTVTITHTASSTDSAYDTLDAKEVTVTVTDDDSASDPGDPDTTPPDAPIIASPDTTDSPTPTIAGTAEASSTLRLTITLGIDSSVIYTATVGADGDWSIDTANDTPVSGTFSGLEDGQYAITATATDAAGNTSEAATQTLTVDIPKPGDPAAPQVTSPALTDSPTPTISGTGEVGVTITLTIDLGGGASVTYETTTDGDGNWSIDLATATPVSGVLPEGGLSDGSYPVTVTATNETGSASTQHTLTVQTSTPAAGTTLYLPLIAR